MNRKMTNSSFPSTSEQPANVVQVLDRICADENAFFKHEQRGDPDLTHDEKRTIIRELYCTNKAIFVQRYNKYLKPDNWNSTFAEFAAEYGQKQTTEKTRNNVKKILPIVMNRRFAKLQSMLEDKSDEYFSDWEMRQRAPLLYDQMIGQYLTKEELTRRFQHGSHSRTTITGMFTDFADASVTSDKLIAERTEQDMASMGLNRGENEGEIEVENTKAEDREESSEESEMEDKVDEDEAKKILGTLKPPVKMVVPIDRDEQLILREEYLALMKERFLAGEDALYADYASIDEHDRLDDLQTIGRDAEERWFDED